MAVQRTPAQVVEALRDQQRQRWQGGEHIPAEAFLEGHPTLQADASCALKLVYQEVLLREECGETPELAEYVQRFPQFAAQLAPLFEVHRALDSFTLLGGRASIASGGTMPAATLRANTPPPAVAGYEILGELGRGGMGVVYRARQLGLDRLVALKMILAGAHAGAKLLARFRAEAESQARLQHPHIVQIYDIGESDGRPYFALELVDGGSLAQKLAGTPQPDRAAAELVETLARAVQVAHDRGLVHRDLKPANILLTADGTPKISDFGLAKRLEGAAGQTSTGAIVGTPAYMAPEQAAGQTKAIGPATDVYALGVILYELLTGRPPFLAESALDTLLQVRQHEPVPPRRLQPKVARDLETICLKSLQKEPGQRYRSAESLAQDLRRWLQGEPIQARPTPVWSRALKWIRRRPAAAALVALSGSSAVALVAVILVDNARLREREAALAAASAAEQERRTETRAALDMLSANVIDEWLSRQQELLPEHKRFLEQALRAYEKLARDTGQDEATRAGVAQAHFRIGTIRHNLGEHEDAERAYRASVKLFQQLAGEFPEAASYRQGLASSYGNLGNLLAHTGRPEDSERAQRDALRVRRQLVADFPEVRDYRFELAQNLNNLGVLLADTGRWPGAEAAYREGLALFKQLDAELPAPMYRRSQAVLHNGLGILLAKTNRPQEAEAAFGEAIRILAPLAAEFPSMPEYRTRLAAAQTNLGILLMTTGRLREAESADRAAIALREQLTAQFPTVPQYQQELAQNYGNLGNLLANTGRAQEAERAYRDALKILKELVDRLPSRPDYRNDLAIAMGNLAGCHKSRKDPRSARHLLEQAMSHIQAALAANPRHPDFRETLRNNRWTLTQTLLELGDHTAAALAAAQLEQAAIDPALDQYNVACLLALCVPLAERDARLSQTQRQRLPESYADRAMSSLRQAVHNGYKDAAHMAKDTDLDALRSRPDFKQLLAELATQRSH